MGQTIVRRRGPRPPTDTELARAIELEPTSVDARLAYATRLRERGSDAAAADVLWPAFLDAPTDQRVIDALGAALGKTDRNAAAELAAFAARDLGSHEPAHVHAWALAALASGDRDGARVAVTRLTSVVEESATALLELAKLHAAIGDAVAFDLAARAVELAPDHAEAHYFHGVMLELAGERDAAADHHAHALALCPRHWAAAVRRAALLVAVDQDGEALELLQHAERYIGPAPAVLELRATISERRGASEDARLLREVVKLLS